MKGMKGMVNLIPNFKFQISTDIIPLIILRWPLGLVPGLLSPLSLLNQVFVDLISDQLAFDLHCVLRPVCCVLSPRRVV